MSHETVETDAARKAERSLADQIYLPAIVAGLVRTFRHFVDQCRKLAGKRGFTLQYPEEQRVHPPRYRGEPRLKVDSQDRLKCVACYLCQTACPAQCIHIVAEPSPWSDRDKMPKIFNLDMLRCIYCGYCEEACPCDAIALSPVYNIASFTRAERVYDKERLRWDPKQCGAQPTSPLKP